MKIFPTKKENYWISLSDIMTVLMVIFLFIAITYMRQVRSEQEDRDRILIEYQETNIALYEILLDEFEDDFSENRWHAELGEDLSIRFLNEEVLFDYNSVNLKTEFQNILSQFFPRYINILLDERFRDKIAEVRIEGHTDSVGPYMYNVELSQNRTANVLNFLFYRNNSEYAILPAEDQKLMRYWFTTTGYSFGRTLDSAGEYSFYSNQPEDADRSRRVEFRIVTKSEEVVNQMLRLLND
ncbi:OmpA family protein [Rhodohalobacter sp. SW132]|uniref:OmpA family protein n=1 Tax=Rhodohalobacter sp. SW132 TaxID=2293433 RepID=UPI001315335D|nr:OmpA family protein [Rhodohalobacter sp. SW132]